jgi:uncharacterized protein
VHEELSVVSPGLKAQQVFFKKGEMMKKRLRKKRCVGEFQVFGFGVGFRLSPKLSAEDGNVFLCRFLGEAIEGNDLVFGGGGDGSDWSGYICPNKIRSTATDAHREVVKQWFIAQSEVVEYHVSPLVDAWYSSDDGENAEWIKK